MNNAWLRMSEVLQCVCVYGWWVWGVCRGLGKAILVSVSEAALLPYSSVRCMLRVFEAVFSRIESV